MTAVELVCVGNLTIDEVVFTDGHRVQAWGGDALFAALGARLVGGKPQILAPLGDDAPADMLSALRLAGTPPSALPRRMEPIVRNVVRYHADGSRTWELVHGEAHFERLSVTPADVRPHQRAACAVLLSGMGLRAQLTLSAWWRANSSSTIYFDPQEVYLAGHERELLGAVAACDVFLPSEIEATHLAGTADLDTAIARFLKLGPSTVVVKRAEEGCLVATRDAPHPVPVPAEPVTAIDGTGAGDTFCGAFAAAHQQHRDAVKAAAAGAEAASIAVSGVGISALVEAVDHACGDQVVSTR
jgi:ribokinase